MSGTRDLRIEYLPLPSIKSAKRNPKAHAGEQITASLGRFGMVDVAAIHDERTGRIVAGHGRITALRALHKDGKPMPEGLQLGPDGEWMVPVLKGWQSRSDNEAEAFLVAHNRLTEAGGWNVSALGEVLKDLQAADALTGVGFDEKELARVLAEAALPVPTDGNTDVDDVPPEPDAKAVYVKPGDMFELGNHRIVCGSSTEAAVVDRVMAGDTAHIVWTDPPWNVAYGEGSRYTGEEAAKNKHKVIANDNLGAEFPAFVEQFCTQILRVSKPGAMLYMVMAMQEMPTIHLALVKLGFHWSSTIIWAKDSLVLTRRDYHPQYEPMWYGWNAAAPRLCPLEDRKQSDLWNVARPKRSDDHPTTKPVELIARSLENSSHVGDVCFEPFSGSGSTLMACEQTGRRCRAIELEPKYVQVCIERWEAFTGLKARKV